MRNSTTAMETEATHGDGDDSHYNKTATARVMATTSTDGAATTTTTTNTSQGAPRDNRMPSTA